MSGPRFHGPPGESKLRPAPPSSDCDLHDSTDEIAHWSFLRDALGRSLEALLQVYDESDAEAARQQRVHHPFVVLAAATGSAAVVAAILQLSAQDAALLLGTDSHWHAFLIGAIKVLEILELIFVVVAVFAFIFAESRRKKWFVQRHRSERCRMAKFDFLIDPKLWGGGEEGFERRVQELRDEAERIRKVDDIHDVHNWMEADDLREIPIWHRGEHMPAEVMGQLKDYYRSKRLVAQIQYFEKKSSRMKRRDDFWRAVPLALFGVSVGVVLLHTVYNAVSWILGGYKAGADQSPVWVELVPVGFITLAAIVPVLASGIRSWRAAHESTRNMIRFRAKHVALLRLSERIEKETNMESSFRDMWCCEQIMESEHREWLRLMTEAEWFG